MRFFDFFAGIGGFRLGMEMAGHECVGHCEIDKYADLSYRAMHQPKESEVSFDDIRTVDPADMPECEVYCFGFPCQAFSIAGHRRGFDDTRGTLFFEVMRLAKERHPQILFAENVAGLLNHEGGVVLNNDNENSRKMIEQCYQRSKVVINPIIDWPNEDVWEFIHEYNVPYCKLYDQGYKRLGCIGCPMGHNGEELEKYPKYKQAYLRAFKHMLEQGKARGIDYKEWKDENDVYKWWTSQR